MARKKTDTNEFCAWDGDTLVLNILGTPSAKQDVINKHFSKEAQDDE